MRFNNAKVILAPDLAESRFYLRDVFTNEYHCRMSISKTIGKLANQSTVADHKVFLGVRPDKFVYRHTPQNRIADQVKLKTISLNPLATTYVDQLIQKLFNYFGIKYNRREIVNILVDYNCMEL